MTTADQEANHEHDWELVSETSERMGGSQYVRAVWSCKCRAMRSLEAQTTLFKLRDEGDIANPEAIETFFPQEIGLDGETDGLTAAGVERWLGGLRSSKPDA